MKITKRDGTLVAFNRDKVINAISKAIKETDIPDDMLPHTISMLIEQYVDESEDTVSVESIQDKIEVLLAQYGRFDVAKKYILYRAEKTKNRGKKTYKFLASEFLSKYKHADEPFSFDIGKVTYYRTYSRPIPEENRREYWWETVARVIDFSAELEYRALKNRGTVSDYDIRELKSTAEIMYDMMFNLKLFPSGRTLWVGGTETSYSNPISNFNCSFMTIDNLKKFSEMLLVLMLGTGVGLSVESKYVSKLPKVNTNIEVIHKKYNNADGKKEHTELINVNHNTLKIVVGDSRFGWAKGLELFLEILTSKQYSDIENLIIDYDYVRPYGTRIKTFGGQASGHEALEKIFTKIYSLFKKQSGWAKIKPIDALDIATAIAEGVVAGGTRRSALIVFCDPDDKEVLEAKQNLYAQDESGAWSIDDTISHRSLSNNTVLYEDRPTMEQLKKQFELIRFSGEPAFGNLAEMRRRREDAQGGNPCFEILLRDRGTCNLTEINMMGFVDDEGNIDYEGLHTAQRMSAKIGYRMASIELELNEWNSVNVEDRLTGCSLTGVMDFINKTNISDYTLKSILQSLRLIAHDETEKLSKKFNMNKPKLVTTVKPSGTISLLPTVSSGVHFSHSPYYIRRIRINSADPLAKALVKSGFTWYPENGETLESHKTKVFEFPVKAPMGRTKYDVSAIEQLELYKTIMENYVDHNASNTVHVRDDEWDDVVDWVYNNWDCIVGVTFLSLSDSFYQLMPLESITEEQYNELVIKTPKFNPNIIKEFESFEEEFELGSDCDSGACPVR